MLIMLQRPDATKVAGYRTWQSLGRHVQKGERAIRIIAPSSYKRTVEAEDGEQEEQRLFFRSVSVFDTGQTEGKPLPLVHVPVLYGTEGWDLYRKLEGLARGEGLSVTSADEDLMGSAMGHYDSRRWQITLRDAALLQMTKTLAHELGHHFARHERSDPASETEAEGVAYVVLAHFGLDSGERGFPYVATWAKDGRVLRAALTNIQRISLRMIDRLAPTNPDLSIE
jgi:antirestriction protein ArdC